LNKLDINSGYIGSDVRNRFSGSFGMEKLYIQRLQNNIIPFVEGVVTTNLLVYINAKESTSYPGAGSVWNDISGNNINLTLFNGPTYVPGVTASFTFDGTNDYGSYTGNTASLDTVTNQVTLAALWKPSGFNIWSGLIGRGSAGGTGVGTWTLQNHNTVTGKLMFSYNAANPWNINTVSGSTIYTVGRWYYTAVTYDGADVKFYVDGVLTDTKTIGPITFVTSGSLEIGHDPPGGDEFFNGSLANAQVYSRALSQTEIQNNFTTLRSNYI
jgi:hypothetical protein